MLISPVILVRFLSVAQFGIYREFLMYGSILTSIAAFNINNSLMYFIPAHPRIAWRFVHQSTCLVAANSLLIIGLTAALNRVTHQAIVGQYMLPLAAYTFFFVNVDFWEYQWLSQRQPQRVLIYTVSRLAVRVAVVVAAAALSRGVDTIIWWLVGFECVRMLASFVAWRLTSRPMGEPMPGSWRLQITSCLPLGGSLILTTLLRNAGGLFVTKLMGAAALAQFTVGTYVAPIVVVLRNSISDALLPEMSARRASEPDHALQLWQKSTVVFAMLLLPAAVLLIRFAKPLIVTLFSAAYSEAIPIFQLYALLLVRECADFGVLIRAVDRNHLLLRGNLIALAANLALLAVLVPLLGLQGAVLSYLCARFAEGLFQLWQVSGLFRVAMRKLLPLASILRVSVAALLACAVLLGGIWESAGLLGVACGSLGYLLVFAILLWFFRVPEAREIGARARKMLLARFR
jgi:O-antigen/teichoic acid export membrane protein